MNRYTIPIIIMIAGLLLVVFAPQLASLPVSLQLALILSLIGLVACDMFIHRASDDPDGPLGDKPIAARPKTLRWSGTVAVALSSSGLSSVLLSVLKTGIGYQYQSLDVIVFNVVITTIIYFSVQAIRSKRLAKAKVKS